LIERIEIVRGPSSSLYGTSAFVAVINVITKSAQTGAGLEFSGDAGGFGAYRDAPPWVEPIMAWMHCFLGRSTTAPAPLVSFSPHLTAPDQLRHRPKTQIATASRSFYGYLHFRHFTLEGGGRDAREGHTHRVFGQVFNDNRSQTIDSSGYLKLGYSRPIFQDAEFAADVYFDRAIYHGVYVYSPVAGLQTDVLNEDASRGDVLGTNARITKTLWQKHKATVGVEFRDNLRQDQTNYNVNPFQPVLDDRQSTQNGRLSLKTNFTIRRVLILNAGFAARSVSALLEEQPTAGCTDLQPSETNHPQAYLWSGLSGTERYELYYSDHVSIEPNPYLQPEKYAPRNLSGSKT